MTEGPVALRAPFGVVVVGVVVVGVVVVGVVVVGVVVVGVVVVVGARVVVVGGVVVALLDGLAGGFEVLVGEDEGGAVVALRFGAATDELAGRVPRVRFAGRVWKLRSAERPTAVAPAKIGARLIVAPRTRGAAP